MRNFIRVLTLVGVVVIGGFVTAVIDDLIGVGEYLREVPTTAHVVHEGAYLLWGAALFKVLSK